MKLARDGKTNEPLTYNGGKELKLFSGSKYEMVRMLPGDQLCKADQNYVLAAYCHRFTGEHKPDWARKPWMDGKPYPVQHATDLDWLRETKFAVRKDGRLDARVDHCESTPSWPFNPELRKQQ